MSEENKSKQMSEQNKPKHYQPKDIRSPWITIYLLFLIFVGFNIIFRGYWHMPFKDYLILSLFMAAGICFCSFLICGHCLYCTYVETTDEEITGKTLYKFNKNALKFNEIKEIGMTKGVFIIRLKDIHGNKLGILFRSEAFVPLLIEILEKSINCTKIDIDYNYYMKHKVHELSEIKPFLDKRLAEIKEKAKSS